MQNIKEYFIQNKKLINARISFHLENRKHIYKKYSKNAEDTFSKLSEFSLGGKGLRGGLFIASTQMFGLTANNLIYDIAACLELLQASLLIHDDIMDNDILRRGKPSIYSQFASLGKSIGAAHAVEFGKSMGICTGDIGFFVMLDIFRQTLKKTQTKNKEKLYSLLLDEMTVVCIGQMDDLFLSANKALPKVEDVISMYTYKTARYTFSLPLVLGAVLTDKPEKTINQVEKLGEHIGVLFQVGDDEIDSPSTETDIKKNTIKTYAKSVVKKYTTQAMEIIDILPVSNKDKNFLKQLTAYVFERSS